VNVIEALNEAARSTPGRQTHRTRSLLLIVQIGLSVVLLVAAGLVVRSFMNLRSTDLGFVPSQVVSMTLGPRDPKPSANLWMHELLRRVNTLPEVDAAGAVYLRPLALGPIGQETSVLLEGQPDTRQAEQQNPALNYQVATPGYFTAMRIQVRSGRLFNGEDVAKSTPVVLVSETAARGLWPGQDPIGKRLSLSTFTPDGAPRAWRTVVGVVSDVRYRGMGDVRLDVYEVASQSATAATDVVVRASGDPRRVAAAVQTEARRMDPRVIVDRLTTMDAIVRRAVAPWRFGMWMFTAFAALALMLAMVGLFSLVSLDVAQRHREFAVRLALGARPRDIVRPVLAEAAGRVLAGVALGVIISLAATRAIGSLLFGVGTLDVTTYAAVVALIAGIVAIASLLPARRAASIDPLVLLRRD
jgi:putative ABC transport system permease protein